MTNAQNFESMNVSTLSGLSPAEQLSKAYDIVSGYLSVDDDTLKLALEILRKDKTDPDFANLLIKLYEDGNSFKEIENPDEYLNNIKMATEFLASGEASEAIKEEVEDNQELFGSLTFSGLPGDVTEEDAKFMVTASNGASALLEVAFSPDISSNNNSESGNTLKSRFKEKLRRLTASNIFGLRYTALKKQGDDVKDTFNLKKVVDVPSDVLEEYMKKVLANKYVNRLIEKSKKAKPYLKKFQYYAVTALVVASSFLSSCTNSNGQNTNSTPVQATQVYDEPSQEVVQEAPATQQKVTVVKEYSDSLGISERAWQSTISFANNSFTQQLDDSTTVSGYDYAYMRLTDDVMKNFEDSTTREQVLNAYRYLRSMYPNPEKLENKGIDSAVLEAAQKAQEMDQYFNGCSENFPENAASIMIDQVVGNLNKRATGIDEPCDKDNVRYVSTRSASRHTNRATQVVQTAVEEADTTSQIIEAPDTATVVTNDDFDFTQASVVDRPVYFTQTTEAELDIEKRKGNDVSNGNFEGKATAKEALATEAQKYDIDYGYQSESEEEDDDGFDVVTTSVEQRTSDASAGEQEDVTVVSDTGTNSDDEVMDIFLDAGEADSNVADTLTTSSEVSVEQTALSSDDNSSSDDVDKKVVGIDEAEIGTPSAGYVAERGGYNNSGLSKGQIERVKGILGDTYDNIIENSPDEWFNRGGLAEGWTREELAYAVADWVYWKPSNPSLKAIINYVNCDKEIADAAQVRKDLDRVYDNMSIDGIKGNRKIKLRSATITCKDVRVATQRGGAPFPGYGNKLPRLFMVETQESFDVSSRVVDKTEVIKVPVESQPNITLNKGNDATNGNFERQATQDEALGTKAPNLQILFGWHNSQKGH